MPPYRWTLIPIVMFLCTSSSAAEMMQPDRLFQSSDVLDVRIVAPISTLLKNRASDTELAGTMQFRDTTGTIADYDIQLRARGHFRRDRANCRFPPLRLNFKKSQTKGTLFHNQDKIKLVTHCQNSSAYEQVLLREYLAYRLLNAITDISFKVRLLRVAYVNSEKDGDEDVRYAFAIEHKDRLAARMQLSTLNIEQTNAKSLQAEYASRVTMFHFLIGNTDFSSIRGPEGEVCCHNHVLLGNGSETVWSVPYDFDQAGFVNAPHAEPSSQFSIRTVKQRLFRGRCIHKGHLKDTVDYFQSKKADILAVIHDFEHSDERSGKWASKYVGQFYEVLDSERRLNRALVDSCI